MKITRAEARVLDAWAWHRWVDKPWHDGYKKRQWDEFQLWGHLQIHHSEIEKRWYMRAMYPLFGAEEARNQMRVLNKRAEFGYGNLFEEAVKNLLQKWNPEPDVANLTTLINQLENGDWSLARSMRKDGMFHVYTDLQYMVGPDKIATKTYLKEMLDDDRNV